MENKMLMSSLNKAILKRSACTQKAASVKKNIRLSHSDLCLPASEINIENKFEFLVTDKSTKRRKF